MPVLGESDGPPDTTRVSSSSYFHSSTTTTTLRQRTVNTRFFANKAHINNVELEVEMEKKPFSYFPLSFSHSDVIIKTSQTCTPSEIVQHSIFSHFQNISGQEMNQPAVENVRIKTEISEASGICVSGGFPGAKPIGCSATRVGRRLAGVSCFVDFDGRVAS